MTEKTEYARTLGALARQVLALLETWPEDTPVVMSKDAEGNDFSPLSEVSSDGRYEAESTWSGYYQSADPEDEEPYEGGVPAICLWPVN